MSEGVEAWSREVWRCDEGHGAGEPVELNQGRAELKSSGDGGPPDHSPDTPAAIYRATARSPEILSQLLNERLAAQLSARFIRLGIGPNTVTALGVLVHLVTAGLLLALPSRSMLPAALVVLVGWHLAYSLDCSDGQVARTTGKTSSEGAVLDLLADYLSHTVVFALVWLKVLALTELANDGFSAELGGLFALTAGGWFASLHNQALNASAESGTGILKSHIGGTKIFMVISQGRHVMDTSLAITALAVAMAVDGYALLGVLIAVSTVRLCFLVARFVGLLLVGFRKDFQSR